MTLSMGVPVPKPSRLDRKEKEHKGRRFGFYGPGWAKAKADALKRDGYRCLECGSREDVEVHHVTRIGFKGRDDAKHALPNLASLCWRHHARAEDGGLTREHFHQLLRRLYGYRYGEDA